MNIHATDVRKTYGTVTALDGLTLIIPTGSTFGILGTNGAGKSTLFRLLVGHDRPDAGTIEVGGYDVTNQGRRIRERIGYLPEHVGFPDALTGREALTFHATVRGLPDDGRIPEVIEQVGLDPSAADRAVSGYSNGMQRRLGLATVLLPEPDVLILDEPTAGLDPRGVDEFHATVGRIKAATDATVVFCSHALAEVERLCDQVAVLHAGEVRASGSVAAVVSDWGQPTSERRGSVDSVDADSRSHGLTNGDATGNDPTENGSHRPDLRTAFHEIVSEASVESAEVSP